MTFKNTITDLHAAAEQMEEREADYEEACTGHACAALAAGAARTKAYHRQPLAAAAALLEAELENGADAAGLLSVAEYLLQGLCGLALVEAEDGRRRYALDDRELARMLAGFCA